MITTQEQYYEHEAREILILKSVLECKTQAHRKLAIYMIINLLREMVVRK